MMVETEQDRSGGLGGRTEVNAGLSAPGADLEHRSAREPSTSLEAGFMQGKALIVGHESPSCSGEGEEGREALR